MKKSLLALLVLCFFLSGCTAPILASLDMAVGITQEILDSVEKQNPKLYDKLLHGADIDLPEPVKQAMGEK